MATQILELGAPPGLPAAFAALVPLPSLEVPRSRVALGGLLIDQVSLMQAGERIADFICSGRPHQIVTVNLDFVSIANRDAVFRDTINDADLAVPDGMPLVWASRVRGQPLVERVAGVELVKESCRVAAQLEASVFLLGAAPGVADAASKRLAGMYPGLRIAGTYSPPAGPVSPEHQERILGQIRNLRPDVLFVALGAPR